MALFCSTCYAGSTNYFAQRVALTQAQRGTNSNFNLKEQLPYSLLPNLVSWLPFYAPTVGTQYCFAVNCATDFLMQNGARYTNLNSGALWLDGSDDQAINNVVTDGVFTGKPISICAWVRPTTAAADGTIVGKAIPPGGNWSGFILVHVAPNTLYYIVGSGAAQAFGTVAGVFANNTWVFLCAVWDSSGDIQLYKNGIQQTVSKTGLPYTGSISNTTATLIGRQSDAGRAFGGAIGELYIWKRAITTNEQFQIYTQTKGTYGL